MKFDIILAGVGGQGVLSVSAIIASSAMKEGLAVKQSEVHGMSQRGGAVLANLRLSDRPIASDLIPRGSAAMILSMEPLESLRYLEFLSAERHGRSPRRTRWTTSRTIRPIDEVLAQRPQPAARADDRRRVAGQEGRVGAGHQHGDGRRGVAAAARVVRDHRALRRRRSSPRKGANVVETNLKALHAGRAAASRLTGGIP